MPTYVTDATTTWAVALGGDGNALEVTITTPGAWVTTWGLHLAAPAGQALAVGTYDGATNPPGAASPALSIVHDGMGCSSASGSFTISELVTSGGVVTALALSIEHHCQADTAPADWIDVRFASAVPLRALTSD